MIGLTHQQQQQFLASTKAQHLYHNAAAAAQGGAYAHGAHPGLGQTGAQERVGLSEEDLEEEVATAIWGEQPAHYYERSQAIAVLGTSADIVEECSQHLQKMSWVETCEVIDPSNGATENIDIEVPPARTFQRDSADMQFAFSPSNMSFGMSPPQLVHSMSPITAGVWKRFLNDVRDVENK